MLSQQLFYDHTENGMINQRIMIAFIQFAEHLILTEEQRERYLNALVMQAKKLFAVWTHLDRFRREVERLKPLAPVLDKDSPSKHFEVSYSQELYLEFDEFLVQGIEQLGRPGSSASRFLWTAEVEPSLVW